MRTVITVCLVLAGVASVTAQEYQSPVAPLPPTVSKPIDTSSATQGATPLPANSETAKAQTQGTTAQTQPAQANPQQH